MAEWYKYGDELEHATKAAVEYLLAVDNEQSARLVLNSRVRLDSCWDESPGFIRVTLMFPPRLIERARAALDLFKVTEISKAFEEAFYGVAQARYSEIEIDTALAVDAPTETWREEVIESLLGKDTPGNQARVSSAAAKREPPFAWNGLGFQSRTETHIARALSEAHVLFFPLPAAVAGVQKKEPDFLVCADGKWGILEVQGDKFHPPETAAKEHDRGRWFQSYGVRLFQIYDAKRCYSDPDDVVAEFLKLLRAS